MGIAIAAAAALCAAPQMAQAHGYSSSGSSSHGYGSTSRPPARSQGPRYTTPNETRQQARPQRPSATPSRNPARTQGLGGPVNYGFQAPRYIPPRNTTQFPATNFTNPRQIPRSFIVIPNQTPRFHRGRGHRGGYR
jgi:hypothetical protein